MQTETKQTHTAQGTTIVLRRTFEARQYPKDSPERARLNLEALTSEYMPSYRYLVRRPFLMSDGSTHPTQPFIENAFRTKAEAEAAQ